MAAATQLHYSAFWSQPSLAPRLAVLVLNAPLGGPWRSAPPSPSASPSPSRPRELFWSLWSRAELTVCADGGANRLFERCGPAEAREPAVPRFIKGDLDSLRPDVRQFYEQRGATVVRDASQDTNDLDKCLQLIHEQQQAKNAQERFSVVIFGAMGGRFDQEMQNVNALFRWRDAFSQIVLLSEDTTARLLVPDVDHVIRPNLRFETRTCGLIPVAGACEATTTSGLKWNLDGDEMKFGGLISSSNHIVGGEDQENQELAEPEVRVRCSHPLIWTTELRQ